MAAPTAKLIDRIAEQIHSKIVTGKYQPGERLKQELLAREFSVSRTPIREALSRLEARGIVAQAQRRSAVVCAPSPRDISEMYQIRAELEGLAAQLAARWITDEQLAGLRASHEDFVSAVTSLRADKGAGKNGKRTVGTASNKQAMKRWIETNAQFHRTICASSNNRNLQRIIEDIASGYTRNIMSSSALGMNAYRIDSNIRHHERILRALEDRDPERARKVMTEHIVEAGEFGVSWFENQARG